ncbi:MAG: MopE-related protein [bacterium]
MRHTYPGFGFVLAAVCSLALLGSACGPKATGTGSDSGVAGDGQADVYIAPVCEGGTDLDGDGYGPGCPAGPDCDDTNEFVHPGAPEVCNGEDDNCDGTADEGVLSPCGDCNPHCTAEELGIAPFPMPADDPDHVQADGVGLDPNGDIILDESNVDFNFMWVANTNDLGGRGTVSKIDTITATEEARYFSVTCFGNPSYQNGLCQDVAGRDVNQGAMAPSRTAVDFNFDVWVANRTFNTGVAPSVTKIANNLYDCVDRNANGVVDTSQDQNGDGTIDTDCDANGVPDDITTVCNNGLPPEFLGPDDECILFTTLFGDNGDVGRSVCLDGGDQYYGGAGNAWVGTNARSGTNRFYKIDATAGTIADQVDIPTGHNPYGCAVDSEGILWSASQACWDDGACFSNPTGRLIFFDVYNIANVGPLVLPPDSDTQFYGIGVDSDDNLWMGGWGTSDTFRYRPNRQSFGTLGNGTWTRILTSQVLTDNTAGIAADLRGYIWVASDSNGHVLRIPQSIADGTWPGSVATLYNFGQPGGIGGQMRGVGVDFSGNIWGVSHDASLARRMDVDAAGDPVGTFAQVATGVNPYTYSDFTGYGLRNFTRPRGTYTYLMDGCAEPQTTTWVSVQWSSTEPPDTRIRLRVRTGDGQGAMGSWFGPWDTSPAVLADPPLGPVDPNPSPYLQVEFELSTDVPETTPVLHDFQIIRSCSTGPEG